MPKDRVLFVCTNGARSQMAGAILAKHAKDRFKPCCAAVAPGKVDHRTAQVLRDHGMDTECTWLYPLAAVRGQFREAIALDESVELPSWLTGRLRSWPMPDPMAGNSLEAFEQARDLIEIALFDWLTKFEEREPVPEESLPAHRHGRPMAQKSSVQGRV